MSTMAGMGTGMGTNMGGMGTMGGNMGGMTGMGTMGATSMAGMGMGMGGMSGMNSLADTSGTSLMGGLGMGMANRGSSMQTQSKSRSGGSSSEETCQVFVRNIPFNYTWQDLKERFRHIGEVRFAAIRTENGRSKGCGVVRFSTPEDARKAVNMMNLYRLEGREIEVRLDRG